jgi:hypothetical protein
LTQEQHSSSACLLLLLHQTLTAAQLAVLQLRPLLQERCFLQAVVAAAAIAAQIPTA